MNVFAFMTEGFETVECLAVVDILRRADINTITVSITGNNEVRSAQGIVVKTDCLFGEYTISDEDVLFLPGGPGTKRYYECEELLDILKKHAASGGRVAAICAAPSVLGNLGILEGKKATCFPGFEDKLKGAEVLTAPVKVITDGNITTSRGMGTSIELGLELIRVLKGEEESLRIGKAIQFIE
ncbi:MAG: DJ-1 family glyoxalase III [Lachnospira sp.]